MNQILTPVVEASQVGEIRRITVRLAEQFGFEEADRGRIAIVATEMANNIIKHAGMGHMVIGMSTATGAVSIELLALDRGPGMADMQRCLRDGFSTAGTPGNGLGAISRLANQFDLYSAPGQGTAVFASVAAAADATQSQAKKLRNGVVCRPVQGETACGDAWRFISDAGKVAVIIADGLGHGALAAEAAKLAVDAFLEDPFASPATQIERAHKALQGGRGAAVAIARLDLDQGILHYAGVGNISGSILGNEQGRGLFSHNGIVGVSLLKLQEFEYPWPPRSTLVMHSDGLGSRWDLAAYPGLRQRHPALIAGVLFREFARERDDVTVLAVG